MTKSHHAVLKAAGALTLAMASAPALAASIAASPKSVEVSESGGRATYQVQLSQPPADTVTVTLVPDGSDVSTSPATLVFTPGNWAVPQPVQVIATDDRNPDGTTCTRIHHNGLSSDAAYRGDLGTVAAAAIDNERGSVKLTDSQGRNGCPDVQQVQVAEGGSADTYVLSLNWQPAATVTIDIATRNEMAGLGKQLEISPSRVVFTTSDWGPKVVTVKAADDDTVEGSGTEQLHHTVSSSDGAYSAILVPDVAVTVADNDEPSLVIEQSGASTNVIEGGSGDSYAIRLGKRPSVPVTITVAPGDARLAASPASLTFAPADYAKPQTVTVSAIDDRTASALDRTGTISNTAQWEDFQLSEAVLVTIIDNDRANLALAESGGATGVAEGGTADSYTLALTARPLSDVTVAIDAGPQLSATPSTVTFNAANFTQPQTIRLQAVDDKVIEGRRVEEIHHVVHSADAQYEGLPVRQLVADVADNDAPGFVLEQSGGSTTVTENGAEDDYALSLAAQPVADVTIDVIAPDGLSLAPQTLTFTAENFDVPQAVHVSAPNDDVAGGPRSLIVTHVAHSGDAGYDALAVPAVTVERLDDDVAGVSIVESDGATEVSEGGAGDSYTIVLLSQPVEQVVVTVGTDAQLAVAPQTVTFTPDDWNVPQTVQVSAVDDAVIEGEHLSTLTHQLSSSDGAYDGLAAGTVTATITDNDAEARVESGGGGGGSLSPLTLILLALGRAFLALRRSRGTVPV